MLVIFVYEFVLDLFFLCIYNPGNQGVEWRWTVMEGIQLLLPAFFSVSLSFFFFWGYDDFTHLVNSLHCVTVGHGLGFLMPWHTHFFLIIGLWFIFLWQFNWMVCCSAVGNRCSHILHVTPIEMGEMQRMMSIGSISEPRLYYVFLFLLHLWIMFPFIQWLQELREKDNGDSVMRLRDWLLKPLL